MTSISTDNNFDIVIVGSGLTGLTTAYNLLRRGVGLSILIIEKTDSVGGRILRGRRSEGYFGSYNQRNITALLDQLEIPIESAHDPDGRLRNFIFLTEAQKNGGGSSKDEISRLVSGQVYHFLKLLNWMSTAVASNEYATNNHRVLGAMSIKRLMETRVTFKRARILCKSLLRACWPGIENLSEVSALWFLVALSGAGGLFEKLSAALSVEKRFFIEAGGGFERLVDTLEKKIADSGGIVRRCENVVKIEQQDRGIRVTSECNIFKRAIHRYECECVVVAVPPPANLAINVETSRLHPDERFVESWKVYQGGSNVFFCGTFDEAFWPASSVLFEGKNEPTRTMHEAGRRRSGTSRSIAGFTSAKDFQDIHAALEAHFGTHDPTSFGTSEASPVYAPRPSSSPMQYRTNPAPVSLDGRLTDCMKSRGPPVRAIFYAGHNNSASSRNVQSNLDITNF